LTTKTQTSNRSDEDIKKLAKRITMLMRDLEAHSMDMVLYSKPLALGKFPQTHIVQVSNALISAITELTRINKAWNDLFKEEVRA
jgi:hypothetical protein